MRQKWVSMNSNHCDNNMKQYDLMLFKYKRVINNVLCVNEYKINRINSKNIIKNNFYLIENLSHFTKSNLRLSIHLCH